MVLMDPFLPSEGGIRLRQRMGWNDPDALIQDFISDLRSVSHGWVNYTVVERMVVDDFPVFDDGFVYTSDEYMGGWYRRGGFHMPDRVDFGRFLTDHHLVQRVNQGEADEVWMIGFPFGGFYESRMVGPGAFWCNSPPFAPGEDRWRNTSLEEPNRRFVVMAFNYERGVGEMLESYGHRAESIMAQVFRDILPERNLWERFTRYDKTHPGRAEVGNIHFAPNSERDYDWGNPRKVLSNHLAWYDFPNLVFDPVKVDCREWGNGDIREHHAWWYRHLPHGSGETDSILNNWWEYIVDPNIVS
jgi:hypothetical protein